MAENEETEGAAAPAASVTVGPPVAPRQQVPEKENEVVYDNIGGHDTKVQVDELEAYIKERDTRRGGFEPEFGVSGGVGLFVCSPLWGVATCKLS